METNDFNDKLQLPVKTLYEDHNKNDWDMKVSQMAKTVSYSAMIFLVYYVINTLLTYLVYSYSKRKVAEIDYARDPSDMKALKSMKEPILYESTVSKIKKIIWLCFIIMVVSYLTSITYHPNSFLPDKRALNLKQAIWKEVSSVVLIFWISNTGWCAAATFCQILQYHLITGISMVGIISSMPFMNQCDKQRVENPDTPDHLYAVENLQHEQLIITGN
ncbi:hypothetical protein WALSEDRAFT_59840 [Wallemia mellicola CBS 633.66]|uniref:Uncharacterized protein n=1 Tax=Wallemia mellicola (strain ATCC MYA-4683 / CBS 633.66) TaxID=671144 RepID=I4YF34_WALMC|nr:hypothetical protein WALSEDRAFT_59840 [Wallemia mellicola CBS 633.66]EIM22576.1 hypothetical protein WALSEDRAFT_59840 [Wallemia mellicola CBS 633.66]|eukprot:XP_006957246.1 hypothetical protein WALSEDRAFT_59840 [Wallemia mellicola CBS 633.66]